MQTAWSHFGAPLMHFRLRDVINVIFGKTAITPSVFKLKASVINVIFGKTAIAPSFLSQRLQLKTKIMQDVILGQPNTKISTLLCRNCKNVF